MSPSIIDMELAEILPGMSISDIWHVNADEIAEFAKLSGDYNPLHMDRDYARNAGYQGQVAHGFLLGAKFSGLLGTKLPGKRCLLLEQSISYPNPIILGDSIVLSIEVKNVHSEIAVVELKIVATKLSGLNEPIVQVARGKVTCKILS